MAQRKKKPVRSSRPAVSQRFKRRWFELSGEPFPPKLRIPKRLIVSLESVPAAPAGGGAAAPTFVFPRNVQGAGCNKMAEIAGWYSAPVGPGGCIGPAAVLAALNAAAAQECCNVLQCPDKCPCSYSPQLALGVYRCTAAVEEGFLLQGQRVFNCRCLAQ